MLSVIDKEATHMWTSNTSPNAALGEGISISAVKVTENHFCINVALTFLDNVIGDLKAGI